VRFVGALLAVVGIGLAALGVLWTLWRAIGAEVDYCPTGDCITAYWISVPLVLLGCALAGIGIELFRRRRGSRA
jgi:hypothetical protein